MLLLNMFRKSIATACEICATFLIKIEVSHVVCTAENCFVLFILLRLGPKIMFSIKMLSLLPLVVLVRLPVTDSQVLGYTAFRNSNVVRY